MTKLWELVQIYRNKIAYIVGFSYPSIISIYDYVLKYVKIAGFKRKPRTKTSFG